MDITTMAMDGDLTVFGDVIFNQCQDMVETKPITFTTPDSFIVFLIFRKRKNRKLKNRDCKE
jgi:hypothetical protein